MRVLSARRSSQEAELPPDVALLLPELDDGELPLLKPLLLELLEEELFELELLELFEELLEELFEFEVPELLVELVELDPEVPEVLVAAWCVEPGRTSATAPAAATPAKPVAAVSDRTFDRPRSLSATALTILLRFMGTSSAPVLGVLCKLLLRQL